MSDTELVLVVEDDPIIGAVVQSALSDEGLRVHLSADGRGALQLVQSQRPTLVLLDMMLPDMTGATVAAALQERWGKEVPIIVVTADGRAEQKAAAIGGVGHLTKPFDLDSLVGLVLRHLPSSAGD